MTDTININKDDLARVYGIDRRYWDSDTPENRSKRQKQAFSAIYGLRADCIADEDIKRLEELEK